MAGLDDILTTTRNAVLAISNLAQTYLNVQGSLSSNAITSATLVKAGSGRLASVSVVVKGSGDGIIYDANLASLTTNAIYTIPQTAGVFVINFPVSNGIVVVPGAGQTISVSYS
jgi:hypothetical protein